MADNGLTVRFWGVRGSHPVPGGSTLKYGGNTSCVEVRANGHVIILDAGTGIIALGSHLLKEIESGRTQKNLTLLFSHTHHDHIQGLPFFTPGYNPDISLHLFGPRTLGHDFEETLPKNLTAEFSPVDYEELKANFLMRNINESDLLIFGTDSEPILTLRRNAAPASNEDVVVHVMRSYAHPKIGTLVYRIDADGKSVVYATDTEGYVGGDVRLAQFARGANLLIHDTQYTPQQYVDGIAPRQGYGHSTYEMAASVANAAMADNLVLFHHDPRHDDSQISGMEKEARSLFKNTCAAHEGLEFKF
jgi:phosphoribosyl 1,2-cyclic phosphodiesterase